ncbi:MAG: hypothetical protein HFE58_13870, partial [Firmicutes bacterium]|nr:hypothetical protein [Bacillota bacterium]
MNTNKKYKDSVFTRYFSDEQKLRLLYNALEGTNYGEETKVNIITLEDVLFMNLKNDICFTIDNKFIILIEHQSTINNNMPLRCLLYIAREYEKLIDKNIVYKSTLQKIPTPHCYVLYNGVRNYPKEKILKLSDAFLVQQNPPELELTVKVININYKENHSIVQQCQYLKEYSYFISVVRTYLEKGLELNDAIIQAVKICIDKNVMKEFLEKNSSEVINMLFTEFDMNTAKEIWKEEAREEGRKEGFTKG